MLEHGSGLQWEVHACHLFVEMPQYAESLSLMVCRLCVLLLCIALCVHRRAEGARGDAASLVAERILNSPRRTFR